MIDWYQGVVLALLQGLTEFLPISSSAHLVIPSLILDWPDQGLPFDVAVHIGTLMAVVGYYRNDLQRLAASWVGSVVGGPGSPDSRLAWYIVWATVPAGLCGVLGRDFIAAELRSLPVIATTTLIFGLALGFADKRTAATIGKGVEISIWIALFIGAAQALALIPGVSRSGVTITAGLLLGLSRSDAARFSFLLSIPIIASAGALKTRDLYLGDVAVNWPLLAMGVLVSGVTAYICIAGFLRLLDRIGMMPFVYYRIALALLLYWLWLS